MNAGVAIERDGASVLVRISMTFKTRGGRREIIVPEGLAQAGPVRSAAQEPIVAALARAFAWQELIETGRYGSVRELAEALGADRCYVRRILTLTMLAPDIVEVVVAGREPSGLSLELLAKGFPLAWDAQRNELAFPAASCPLMRKEATP